MEDKDSQPQPLAKAPQALAKDAQRQTLVTDLTYVLEQLKKPTGPGIPPLKRDVLDDLKRRLERAGPQVPSLGSW